MIFDYEQSVWGKGTASFFWTTPSAVRLRESLNALAEFNGGEKVLEVGCGAGQFIRALKKRRAELLCYGCDISNTAIAEAKTYKDKVIYENNTATALPYPDHFFDAILIYDVLEHVSDHLSLLKEIKRVLNPGGIIYCYLPCEGDWLSLWRYFSHTKKFTGLTEKYAGHINRWSRSQWRSIFTSAGLRVKKVRYSEHLLGQILGLAVFSAMDKAARQNGITRLNNEQFFAQINSARGLWWSRFKKVINILIYLESRLLRFIPSPNTHFILQK